MPVPPSERNETADKYRMNVFRSLSRQNQADIHVTQSRRWLAKNRDRLSQEQVAFLEEFIAALPSSYLQVRTREREALYAGLTNRLWKLFSKGDAIDASSVDAAGYIPPTP